MSGPRAECGPDAATGSAEPTDGHVDVFLSYNSKDHPAVERLARHLKRAGLEPWFDRWSLDARRPLAGRDRGRPAQGGGLRGVRRARTTSATGSGSNWRRLDQGRRRPDVPAVPGAAARPGPVRSGAAATLPGHPHLGGPAPRSGVGARAAGADQRHPRAAVRRRRSRAPARRALPVPRPRRVRGGGRPVLLRAREPSCNDCSSGCGRAGASRWSARPAAASPPWCGPACFPSSAPAPWWAATSGRSTCCGRVRIHWMRWRRCCADRAWPPFGPLRTRCSPTSVRCIWPSTASWSTPRRPAAS